MENTADTTSFSEPAFTPFRTFFMLFAFALGLLAFITILNRDAFVHFYNFWWKYVDAFWVFLNWCFGGSRPLEILLPGWF